MTMKSTIQQVVAVTIEATPAPRAPRPLDRTGGTPAAARDETARRALDAERLWTSRLLTRIRFVGISVAFACNWLVPVVFPTGARYQSNLHIFGVYWVVAGGLYIAGLGPERPGRLVGVGGGAVHRGPALGTPRAVRGVRRRAPRHAGGVRAPALRAHRPRR